MQHLVAISELKSRAEAIGSSLRRLALDAGVHPSTAYRGLNGSTDMGASKVRALMAALERKERRVAEHLIEVGAGNPSRERAA